MGKNLKEIFEELNKPENKLKMVIRLVKEEKQREQQEQESNESKSELSR